MLITSWFLILFLLVMSLLLLKIERFKSFGLKLVFYFSTLAFFNFPVRFFMEVLLDCLIVAMAHIYEIGADLKNIGGWQITGIITICLSLSAFFILITSLIVIVVRKP